MQKKHVKSRIFRPLQCWLLGSFRSSSRLLRSSPSFGCWFGQLLCSLGCRCAVVLDLGLAGVLWYQLAWWFVLAVPKVFGSWPASSQQCAASGAVVLPLVQIVVVLSVVAAVFFFRSSGFVLPQQLC
ncbi:hypothetical protein U1Q18_038263 [Sarracenia purpurea var. burkii]